MLPLITHSPNHSHVLHLLHLSRLTNTSPMARHVRRFQLARSSLPLFTAYRGTHRLMAVTPLTQNVLMLIYFMNMIAPAVPEATNDPPSDEETLDCIRRRAIPNSNASQLAKQNLREFNDNNNGSMDRTLKKNFKAHFISWAQSSRVSDKHFMARELLYQFMLKYNIVLSKGDVKELKREVHGFKGMGEVFDGGWLLPKSEVNV
jgi:hypothetical protein